MDEATQKAINDAVTAAITSALPAALKPLTDAQAETTRNMGIFADTLAKLPPATAGKPVEKKEETAAAPTIEQITKLLDERDKARQTTASATAEREKFVGDKMKDLPEVYRKQLGSDPAQWAAQEQAIREAFKADFKAAGGTVPNVGGNPGGANPVKPGEMLDLSKLSEGQLREMAIKALPPVQRTVTPPTAATQA